jgi:excisionase family DNA binding protein
MDKLLTIKEAAAFLSVSAMSLRRWTNSGKLKCYRLGGRNERRFTRQDLEEYLARNEKDVPLGIGSQSVPDSCHIAHFYEDADQGIAEGVGYLRAGLVRGERLLLVAVADRVARILAGLDALGFPVARLQRAGRVVTSNGQDSLGEQLEFTAQILAQCLDGKGFRLLGDMAWAIDKGWSLSDITRLESRADEVLSRGNNLFLCQYDLGRFGADAAMMAFDTHGLTVYRGQVQPSPYYKGRTA